MHLIFAFSIGECERLRINSIFHVFKNSRKNGDEVRARLVWFSRSVTLSDTCSLPTFIISTVQGFNFTPFILLFTFTLSSTKLFNRTVVQFPRVGFYIEEHFT